MGLKNLLLAAIIPFAVYATQPSNPPTIEEELNVVVDPVAEKTWYRGIPNPSEVFGFDIDGNYTSTQVLTGELGSESVSCTGTAQTPCLIDATNATFTNLSISGSYLVFQGGIVNAPGVDGPHIIVGCSNCVVRDTEVSGPNVNTGHSSAVRMGSFSAWLRGSIHGFGDNRADAPDQDYHGMKIMSDDVWVLDAEIYNVSGDSIQVGDASRGEANRVYIGGGYFHDNRENGVDIKDSHDVVVSGVYMKGFHPSISSPGEALVVHDDSYNARIYDNITRDSRIGIVSSGLTGHVIDNNQVIADYVGIQLRNTSNLTVTNNKIVAPTPVENQGGTSGDIQN